MPISPDEMNGPAEMKCELQIYVGHCNLWGSVFLDRITLRDLYCHIKSVGFIGWLLVTIICYPAKRGEKPKKHSILSISQARKRMGTNGKIFFYPWRGLISVIFCKNLDPWRGLKNYFW